MRKKVDNRIRVLIENGVKLRQRTMLVMVGDKGKEQIPNLHYMLTNFMEKGRPSVLWCYRKELGFTRMNHIKKQIQRGLRDTDEEDPFELFISSTDIRYTYYKDSAKILGNTFGMCILQDWEGLTPNLLARTIETVEGGGLIILLLQTLQSLRQLATMGTMGLSHEDGPRERRSRFAERFLLSLRDCPRVGVVDDCLTLLPHTPAPVRTVTPVPPAPPSTALGDLQALLERTFGEEEGGVGGSVGVLLGKVKTGEQGQAVLQLVESLVGGDGRATVSLTAGRGRGKSAALGLGVAGGIAVGLANIFVSAPSPENLRTFFQFLCEGLDALGYRETQDYELIRSTHPDLANVIVRVNVMRAHRQTVQYIQPQDWSKVGAAELMVIDEAAAIPLPLVKRLIGPYAVFLSSTINGYEGTGRSLSLKLIDQLRSQSSRGGGRTLREVTLTEPIRYAAGDEVESWLHRLLCLSAQPERLSSGCPLPASCELFYVSRDTLFAYHPASESFLQRLVALFVASHYKNSPDDLLLLSDSPNHLLFVLVARESLTRLPDVLCAVQVALEGHISKEQVLQNLSRGKGASGDLIPWTLSQQFQDPDFPALSGGRIVRVATHPEYQKMGYGSRAIELLGEYFSGNIPSLSESAPTSVPELSGEWEGEGTLQTEEIRPRGKDQLPPLLVALSDRPCERLHYLGVSYGVTASLFGFWKKSDFIPVYLRQTQNDITGEHTCIMLRSLPSSDLAVSCSPGWLGEYYRDFRKRFLSLLPIAFRDFPGPLALAILHPKRQGEEGENVLGKEEPPFAKEELDREYSAYDVKRLDSYSRNLVDFHVILDLLPSLARLWFTRRLPLSLSAGQSAILLGMGLQCKSVDTVAEEMTLPVNQVLALFNKALRKVLQYFRGLQEESHAKSLPTALPSTRPPVIESVAAELAANPPSIVSLPSKRQSPSPHTPKEKRAKPNSQKPKGNKKH